MSRDGMSDLLIRARRMVDDSGTAVWTDDEIQDVLDSCRVEFYKETLTPIPENSDETLIYRVYRSQYRDLEGAASGSTAWRVYDGLGSAIGTADYAADYMRGEITFSTDQAGSARYLRGRSYDLNYAAALLCEQRAAAAAADYDFAADGAKFSRAQWFQHCRALAEVYRRQSRPVTVQVVRTDLNG